MSSSEFEIDEEELKAAETAAIAQFQYPPIYHQTTLFGSTIPTTSSTVTTNYGRGINRQRPWESPTHHKIDGEAIKTWIYPLNVSFREYQFNIVSKCLFDNVLVSLPTGLGKTFIAASLILNYYRWFPTSKIVFVAPTRPLVAQQIQACHSISGIPDQMTARLTGQQNRETRRAAWQERSVFYMTPQTLENDLKNGLVDPKSIVLFVIDEAHRGTGKYAYGECVRLISASNSSFRILALSATPGGTIDHVQEVISSLHIARIEIRTEESLDLRQYIHRREREIHVLPLSRDIEVLKELLGKVIKIFLERVKRKMGNDSRLREPLSITLFGIKQAKDAFMASAAGRQLPQNVKGSIIGSLGILSTLAHALSLLLYHGIKPFYNTLLEFKEASEMMGKRIGIGRKECLSNEDYKEVMRLCKEHVENPHSIGHPKLERAAGIIIDHFVQAQAEVDGQAGRETRVIVFVQYRDSAGELVRQLRRQEPIIKPAIFVGQQGGKVGAVGGVEGMSQKEQLDVIEKFQRGVVNVLVATSIGEEGLDIGDVDLIVCYDSQSSPVRMLQRMGRTGRKRAGKIALLFTKGKEEQNYTRAQDAYEKIQQKIAKGDEFVFELEKSARIIPNDLNPECVKKVVELPQNEGNAKKSGLGVVEVVNGIRRRSSGKKSIKAFFMPDGVETGFMKASRLGKRKREPTPEEDNVMDFGQIDPERTGLLSDTEMSDFKRRYWIARSQEETKGFKAIWAKELGRTGYVGHGEITHKLGRWYRLMAGDNATVLQNLRERFVMGELIKEYPPNLVLLDEDNDNTKPPELKIKEQISSKGMSAVEMKVPGKNVEVRTTHSPYRIGETSNGPFNLTRSLSTQQSPSTSMEDDEESLPDLSKEWVKNGVEEVRPSSESSIVTGIGHARMNMYDDEKENTGMNESEINIKSEICDKYPSPEEVNLGLVEEHRGSYKKKIRIEEFSDDE